MPSVKILFFVLGAVSLLISDASLATGSHYGNNSGGNVYGQSYGYRPYSSSYGHGNNGYKSNYGYGHKKYGHPHKRYNPMKTASIDCSSSQYRYKECYTGLHVKNVTVANQKSSAPCNLNQSYGYNGQYLWVNNGCRATFNVNGTPKPGKPSYGKKHKKKYNNNYSNNPKPYWIDMVRNPVNYYQPTYGSGYGYGYGYNSPYYGRNYGMGKAGCYYSWYCGRYGW